MTKYLITQLSDQYEIGVLSRGYGRKTTGFHVVETDSTAKNVGDEPLEIKLQFPRTTVTVCEDRALGIPQMLEHNEKINLVILDDAFQHQYVTPRVSIVLSAYLRPFFRDFVMPVGRLRERRKNIRRADMLVYTKAVSGARNHKTYNKPTYYSSESYEELRQVFGSESTEISEALVVSGIAHNQLFFSAMKEKVARIETQQYRDHHQYSNSDIDAIIDKAKSYNSTVVTTAKDWVKLKSFEDKLPADMRIFVQEVGVNMEQEEEFLTELKRRIDGKS